MPIVLVLERASERANEFGMQPVATIALSTAVLVASLTNLVPFTTWETVEIVTPACRATSPIVAAPFMTENFRAET
jgi:hypothetical protein